MGTLVARNRPAGEKVFGVGSHCDSNRNGGKYDGTMVFVPCKDGISHSPEEDANPADAALGAEIMLNAIRALTADER